MPKLTPTSKTGKGKYISAKTPPAPTIASLKAQGLTGVSPVCRGCHHSAPVAFDVIGLPDETPFPEIGHARRFRCSTCGARDFAVKLGDAFARDPAPEVMTSESGLSRFRICRLQSPAGIIIHRDYERKRLKRHRKLSFDKSNGKVRDKCVIRLLGLPLLLLSRLRPLLRRSTS
jgi:hypothetical protein